MIGEEFDRTLNISSTLSTCIEATFRASLFNIVFLFLASVLGCGRYKAVKLFFSINKPEVKIRTQHVESPLQNAALGSLIGFAKNKISRCY